ncbi:anthranilate synthase component II [Roseofilum casamattae]|uniref:Aminodeoxychorismate/anthranilate synthase component II n=1 Tax=Roseofilum casamattae BLCC-M143 TaxID=3022442 RepID=A0ABT7C0S8_9CYAN|nr:aminodeoxychorismate/anthranilate synthase component II [Roseofilum casamattae]MDJ1184118.1 aminodeoxychorismate/anthranilate synthase component II [Roseofilum casamattae BLCC-M143]
MIVVIDNYDSFTYNLVQYLTELGQEFPTGKDVRVYRNDRITLAELEDLNPDAIAISPGPGRPEDSGISLDAIASLGPKIPILGVCLGHQGIGHVFGAKIVSAPELMHGKTSPIHHNNTGLFANLEMPMRATRYHSLAIERESCPEELEVTAWVDDGTIMGVRHRTYPHIQGVQFHPESILTTAGKQLLGNFLRQLN